jgi:ABC-type phosphate transport system auxiliary subunit
MLSCTQRVMQASLKMVGDELRQELQQLRQESENQQQAALKMEKQHVSVKLHCYNNVFHSWKFIICVFVRNSS